MSDLQNTVEDLREGKLPKKKWWMSKAIWASLLTLACAVLNGFGVEIPTEIMAALTGFGVIFARIGNREIEK